MNIMISTSMVLSFLDVLFCFCGIFEIGSIQNYYITGCPKFCFKTKIGLKMNGTLFCRNE
ncbi:hypothetical protein BWD12_16935 [Leptospira santarosai serovar Bananal]|uniref:Lipoprotein n=1 Tax=Leptospira santarosai TaxID=28183 RepID=A0AB73LLV2_9LEPT|nr:hypothetical protein BWD12_16935 [Leptospira santarosai serovar Bananal]ONF83815.1 hypothetical protein BWD13_17500 [Leptospira santarosai serovar Grippotyphosa]ONF92474.1 hypothetical protein BWD14_13450 [Leptospira santarosai]